MEWLVLEGQLLQLLIIITKSFITPHKTKRQPDVAKNKSDGLFLKYDHCLHSRRLLVCLETDREQSCSSEIVP